MVAIDQPGTRELAHDEARVRDAHAHPPGYSATNAASEGTTMPERYSQHEHGNEPVDRRLRAVDRDRDTVAGIPREQHLVGRLETDEFQERLDRC